MTLVALSASYGAGGSRVGPALAERLGVPFLDRAIPLEVAERLQVGVDQAAAHDDRVSGSRWERLLGGFVAGDNGAPTPLPANGVSSEDFRRTTEAVLLQQAATGEGVILGRASVVVLRDDPRVLRVRLNGPPQRRARQAAEMENVEPGVAERALRQTDRAHDEYVRQFYGVRLDDPSLYHLVLDSTAIDLETCIDVIASAAASPSWR
jgi:Cytidylate kinase-like family